MSGINYQLRWVNRKTGNKGMNEHGYYYDETVRVLQYRVYYDATIYAAIASNGDFLKQMVWSEWQDVPEVEDVKI